MLFCSLLATSCMTDNTGSTTGDADMTLAFELDALQTLADPAAVFNDARQWTEYVGVVSEKPTYVVTNYTRKHRVRQDFFQVHAGCKRVSKMSKPNSAQHGTSLSAMTQTTALSL